jgi:hypothetical protein
MNAAPGRWPLLRDVLVMQVKLVADGLRDLTMSPVLLILGLGAFLIGRPAAAALFYDAVRFGRRTERWIDLFSLGGEVAKDEGSKLDDMLEKVEALVVEQHRRGGITAAAKQALDQALDRLQARTRG